MVCIFHSYQPRVGDHLFHRDRALAVRGYLDGDMTRLVAFILPLLLSRLRLLVDHLGPPKELL